MHKLDGANVAVNRLLSIPTSTQMNPDQKFYIIPGGDFAGFVVCLWCGAILKNNLPFHNCLLYGDIYEWHIRSTGSLKYCLFSDCLQKNYSILDSLIHNYHTHNTVIIYTCDICGVGFVSKIGVFLHRQHTNYQCDSPL